MWNHFFWLEITLPPSDPQNTYYFENFQISAYFEVYSKSRFFRGLKRGHRLQTFYKVLKFIGDDGFIIFGDKNCLILWKNRGSNADNRVNQGNIRNTKQCISNKRFFLKSHLVHIKWKKKSTKWILILKTTHIILVILSAYNLNTIHTK